MKIFYFCQTGVHTALIAASIHLGFLPKDKIPGMNYLTSLNHFGSKSKDQIGEVIYLGKDSKENEIYSLGMLNEKELGPRTVESLLNISGIDRCNYKFINTADCTHYFTKLGLYTEFVLGKNFISNYLIFLGLKKNYKSIVETVLM